MAHSFTRQELYDLVWSEPMSRLAKKLGVSDVGLAKACRRADIPVPGLGYWAKLRHSRKAQRKPLPQANPGIPDEVTITPAPSKPALSPDVQAQIERELAPDQKITVPRTLSSPHPLVRAWLEAERRRLQEAIRRGQHSTPSRLHLTKTERRRLRLLSTLLKELEKRGHKVTVGSSGTHKASVLIGEEKVEFSLDERYRQVVLTPEERRTPDGLSQELQPTGELVFRLHEYLDPGTRVTWRDTSTKPLEEQLNRIIAGLLTAAAILRQHRVKREEEERRYRAAREERMRQEEAQRKEEEQLMGLIQQIRAWRQATDIRAYVEAVRAVAAAGRREVDPTRLQQWASWALAYADRMDPLISGDPLALRQGEN